ncbi:hypothetical protein N0V88_007516 [Collariella sp. IMI 366227]|nr:hypothetical protein N0V88_007516 [Collariella sp. IMI 366227]
MGFPHRPSTFLRYIGAAVLLTLTLHYLHTSAFGAGPLSPATPWGHKQGFDKHPIDPLIQLAGKEFTAKLSKATQTLEDAAAAYRKRRGRHPPPGFDKWYEFATDRNTIIIEDFWDQIYHDLEPFWGVNPRQIRKDARDFEMRIEIRDGKASTTSDWFWTQIWLSMIQTIEYLLPDMDLAINGMDEPRVVVPWEDIDAYLKKAANTRNMADVGNVVSKFGKLPPVGQAPEEEKGVMPGTVTPTGRWETDKHFWPVVRLGCAPNSPARQAKVITNFNKTPFIASSSSLAHMKEGYVANYTLSTDFCHQADLQALEGIFIEPLSVSTTHSLRPIFGGSKLSTNNDILLPAPIYWSEEDRFIGASGASTPWSSKSPSAIWRGVATGGNNNAFNWRSFQRHRFVTMNNATALSFPASNPKSHPRSTSPSSKQYPCPTQHHPQTKTHLMCAFEAAGSDVRVCDYVAPHFSTVAQVDMAAQFGYKYLPDIDGTRLAGDTWGF